MQLLRTEAARERVGQVGDADAVERQAAHPATPCSMKSPTISRNFIAFQVFASTGSTSHSMTGMPASSRATLTTRWPHQRPATDRHRRGGAWLPTARQWYPSDRFPGQSRCSAHAQVDSGVPSRCAARQGRGSGADVNRDVYLDRAYTPFCAAEVFDRECLLQLKNQLVLWSGQPITDAAHTEAIEVTHTSRRLLQQLTALRAADPPRVSGVDALQVIATAYLMDKREHGAVRRGRRRRSRWSARGLMR